MTVVWKISIVSIFMSSDHEDRKTIRSLALLKIMRRSNKVLFLKVLGYRKVRSFKGTLDQFKCVTIETRYPMSIAELLIRNL